MGVEGSDLLLLVKAGDLIERIDAAGDFNEVPVEGVVFLGVMAARGEGFAVFAGTTGDFNGDGDEVVGVVGAIRRGEGEGDEMRVDGFRLFAEGVEAAEGPAGSNRVVGIGAVSIGLEGKSVREEGVRWVRGVKTRPGTPKATFASVLCRCSIGHAESVST